MYFVRNSAIAAFLGFAASVSAHMKMGTPKPFDTPAPAQEPMTPGTFPCHSTGSYSGTATQMALGSSQDLKLIGVATHGGGSCQVSITYDTEPTKNSVWKVLHSIEGGCVADEEGNISTDGGRANEPLPGGFKFPIPTDIPAGKATIAWTWLNRVGNREFYMMCAPVELTGTGGDKANWEALPDMLVTNIPSVTPSTNPTECGTLEMMDYKYPNPGKSVEQLGTHAKLIDLKCPANVPGGTPGKSSGGGGGSTGGGSQPTKSSSGSGSQPTKASSTKPGGVFATAPAGTGSGGNGNGAASSTKSASQPAATGGSTGGSTAGAQTPGSPCSPEGTWNCISGSQYQQCASGAWSVVRPLAAGMTCESGQGATIKLAAAALGRRRLVGFRA